MIRSKAAAAMVRIQEIDRKYKLRSEVYRKSYVNVSSESSVSEKLHDKKSKLLPGVKKSEMVPKVKLDVKIPHTREKSSISESVSKGKSSRSSSERKKSSKTSSVSSKIKKRPENPDKNLPEPKIRVLEMEEYSPSTIEEVMEAIEEDDDIVSQSSFTNHDSVKINKSSKKSSVSYEKNWKNNSNSSNIYGDTFERISSSELSSVSIENVASLESDIPEGKSMSVSVGVKRIDITPRKAREESPLKSNNVEMIELVSPKSIDTVSDCEPDLDKDLSEYVNSIKDNENIAEVSPVCLLKTSKRPVKNPKRPATSKDEAVNPMTSKTKMGNGNRSSPRTLKDVTVDNAITKLEKNLNNSYSKEFNETTDSEKFEVSAYREEQVHSKYVAPEVVDNLEIEKISFKSKKTVSDASSTEKRDSTVNEEDNNEVPNQKTNSPRDIDTENDVTISEEDITTDVSTSHQVESKPELKQEVDKYSETKLDEVDEKNQYEIRECLGNETTRAIKKSSTVIKLNDANLHPSEVEKKDDGDRDTSGKVKDGKRCSRSSSKRRKKMRLASDIHEGLRTESEHMAELRRQMAELKGERDELRRYLYKFDYLRSERRSASFFSTLQQSSVIKPLEFPRIANLTRLDYDCYHCCNEFRNRLNSIQLWLRDQYVLYRDYSSLSERINANYVPTTLEDTKQDIREVRRVVPQTT